MTATEAGGLARSEVAHLYETVDSDLQFNEVLQSQDITNVFHYVISGSHVDPELGYEYVPIDQPLNAYRRRKIAQRNKKTRILADWIETSLVDGKPFEWVEEQLRKKQNYQAIMIANNRESLERILMIMFAND